MCLLLTFTRPVPPVSSSFSLPRCSFSPPADEKKTKKKPHLFQRGLEPLHPLSIRRGVSAGAVLKCDSNREGVTVFGEASEREHVHGSRTRPSPGSGMSSERKWDTLGVPALCRSYFLIPNLHQPPHNNMADPACLPACLRDWSNTAGDTRFRSGPVRSGPAARRDEENRHERKKK